jgi:hypothetical protein
MLFVNFYLMNFVACQKFTANISVLCTEISVFGEIAPGGYLYDYKGDVEFCSVK